MSTRQIILISVPRQIGKSWIEKLLLMERRFVDPRHAAALLLHPDVRDEQCDHDTGLCLLEAP